MMGDFLEITIYLIVISFFSCALFFISKFVRKLLKKEKKIGKWEDAIYVFLSYLIVVSVLTIAVKESVDRASGRRVALEGVVLMSPAKIAVAEYYMQHGKFPNNNNDAGLVESYLINGRNVVSITVSEGGVITCLYKDSYVEMGIDGQTIVLKPIPIDGGVSWDCSLGTMPDKYRPRRPCN